VAFQKKQLPAGGSMSFLNDLCKKVKKCLFYINYKFVLIYNLGKVTKPAVAEIAWLFEPKSLWELFKEIS
jgi:choline kinase